MKQAFKVKIWGLEGEADTIYFLSNKNRKYFEKDYLECIEESKKDEALVSRESHFTNIRNFMEKKGYEEIWVSDAEYRLDDSCPTPNSIKLLLKNVNWSTIRGE